MKRLDAGPGPGPAGGDGAAKKYQKIKRLKRLPVAPGHAERGTAKDAKRLQCVERRGRKRMYVHELVVLKMKDD